MTGVAIIITKKKDKESLRIILKTSQISEIYHKKIVKTQDFPDSKSHIRRSQAEVRSFHTLISLVTQFKRKKVCLEFSTLKKSILHSWCHTYFYKTFMFCKPKSLKSILEYRCDRNNSHISKNHCGVHSHVSKTDSSKYGSYFCQTPYYKTNKTTLSWLCTKQNHFICIKKHHVIIMNIFFM